MHKQLTVKQLAEQLCVSCRFVYEMRACGFTMHGERYHHQTASLQEATTWIEQHDFRLVDGRGVCIESFK